ncbi:hypothetical protein [Thalassomonas actiniarum]|uniref:Uncharacterized protein n=1 Tax=Thalassomonas actiniarum TaxID=485447 RepID=A0AAE9YSX9_9GAMM|nr:hypothetical protein [Thalassomonas actiniarum]WDE00640.1 hypothetical protein SG35_008410 [Thalassomonas actiniarum]
MIIRLLYILLFSFLGALVVYGVAWVLGWAFGPLYSSEADMSRNFVIYLVITAAFIFVGGVVGNFLYLKRLIKQGG